MVAAAAAWLALVRPGPLSLPYFWDEADVYVPGAKWLADNHMDITPGVFPDDYSRGHPQLLYALAGGVFLLFGPAPATGHLVVLPFTLLALVATYLLGARLFSRTAGAAAALLLATTPMFMSIGNMLLPEVPLTALSALALLLFAHGRLVAVALCGAALVLIKETGVFTVLAIAGALWFDVWRRGDLGRPRTWIRLGVVLAPVGLLAAFFVWQKLAAGYFVFPHHQDMFAERPLRPGNLLTVWPSLLVWHGRWVLVGAAAAFWAWHRATGRGPLLAAGIDEGPPWRPRPGSVALAILLLIGANAAFFTKMFWLPRYGLPAHPGLLVLACGTLLGRTAGQRRAGWTVVARALPVAAAAVLGFAGLWSQTAPDEEELTFAYADVIATHRRAFEALETTTPGDAPVLTSWPMTIELRHPYLGYVSRARRSIHVDHLEPEQTVRIGAVLVATRSRHAVTLRRHARSCAMHRAGRFQMGGAGPVELWVP